MATQVEAADTVVVGAGSAGAVIATRMTERSDRQVLLVEAGPDFPELAQLPADLRDGTRNSMRLHDWGFDYWPTPRHIRFPFPRGRVVGGSSAVNTCIALRGHPLDYEEWAALGLPDWRWEHCLPAFKRLENDLDVQNAWHGQGGPIPIRRHKREELVPWQAAFLEACEGLGLPRCADTNDPTTTGHGPHAMNKVNGERMSAARCYLTPEVRARPNLTIRAGTLVRRVLFESGRAVGLEVETRGEVSVIRAGQVVLSGGAICTPGILLRSGIGPRADLERLGIEQVVDLPAVGARLLDHPGSAFFFRPKRGVLSLRHPLIQTVHRFTSKGSAFPNDIQIQPASHTPLKWFHLPLLALSVCVGKPRGVGRLRFTSADPHRSPRIDAHFLADPADRAMAVEGMELVGALFRQKALRDLAIPFWPAERTFYRRNLLTEWVPRGCGSGFHPSGTVPMGPEGAAEAAVDGRGRVRGVKGLLVADASIMPTIPTANTNLATLMIGERFGEWLREGAISS